MVGDTPFGKAGATCARLIVLCWPEDSIYLPSVTTPAVRKPRTFNRMSEFRVNISWAGKKNKTKSMHYDMDCQNNKPVLNSYDNTEKEQWHSEKIHCYCANKLNMRRLLFLFFQHRLKIRYFQNLTLTLLFL